MHASSSGLLLLAHAPTAQQEHILRQPLEVFIEQTISPSQLRAAMAEVPRQAYAFLPGHIHPDATFMLLGTGLSKAPPRMISKLAHPRQGLTPANKQLMEPASELGPIHGVTWQLPLAQQNELSLPFRGMLLGTAMTMTFFYQKALHGIQRRIMARVVRGTPRTPRTS